MGSRGLNPVRSTLGRRNILHFEAKLAEHLTADRAAVPEGPWFGQRERPDFLGWGASPNPCDPRGRTICLARAPARRGRPGDRLRLGSEGGFAHSILLAPDGCLDVVWTGARLVAFPPLAGARRGRIAASSVNIGVRLTCGWAGAAIGASLATAGASEIALEEAWGVYGRRAGEGLRAARGPDAKQSLLESVVAERLGATEPPPDAALESIRLLWQDSCLPLDDLSTRLGTPSRTLRREVFAATGLGPKALRWVFRFQAMWRRLRDTPGAGSAAITAVELGFPGQAHMIRECRSMTGRTPGRLRRAFPTGRNLQDDRHAG